MTDPNPSGEAAGSSSELPPPTFFDPSFERIPLSAAGGAGSTGPVLLLFDPAAHREWVADAAIALATEWTRSGRRTVLADLSLEDPVLHERIGMANQDGVVDIFLYGASLARSARPVPGRGFYLISAGTYTTESEDVFRHPRWEKIVAGFREAQASLLLFVPADARGVAALSRWAGEAMLLGGPQNGALFRSAAGGLAVTSWLAPPGSEDALSPFAAAPPAMGRHPVDPAERFPEPEPAPVAWPEPAAAVRPQPHAPVVVEGSGPAPELSLPTPALETEPPEAARRRTSPVLLALLALVMLAALAWLAWENRALLGLGSPAAESDAGAGKEKAPAAPPRLAQAPRPAGAALPYAVSIRAYPGLAPAVEEMKRQQRRFPETQWYVIYEPDRDGVLWYRVMAGIVGDSLQVRKLRDHLIEEGVTDSAEVQYSEWDLVKPRPLAFSLGEFPTDVAARNAADSLSARGIPAYPVAVPYTDGGERWRVYGGAFPDSATAEPMRKLLEDNRIRAPLVDRTGRPPADPK